MMKTIADKAVRGSVKWLIPFYLFTLLPLLPLLTSCSEDDSTEVEYPDWQVTNENYFDALYATAKQKQDAGDATWRVIRSYALNETTATEPENHIVVEVLFPETGTGTESPLYTDSVQVHYRGRLLPSASYSEGYVFDQSYSGEFNAATALPSEFAVSGLIDGFATAVQYMHVGDHWRVYIPYALGYGAASSSGVPAYSTLIFEIRLAAFSRAGQSLPPLQ